MKAMSKKNQQEIQLGLITHAFSKFSAGEAQRR